MTVAREIPLSLIDVPAGRRKVSPDWIEALAADIERQGLRVPVLLVETGERFRLVAGAHRLAAAKPEHPLAAECRDYRRKTRRSAPPG